MAEGSDSYKGLCVPLLGDFEIKQKSSTLDAMTITGASGGSGDYIVCQSYSGTEAFVVGTAGATVAGTATITGALTQTGVATFAEKPILNAAVASTVVTTGMTTGEIFFYDKTSNTQTHRVFAVARNDGSAWRLNMTNN